MFFFEVVLSAFIIHFLLFQIDDIRLNKSSFKEASILDQQGTCVSKILDPLYSL